MSSSSHVAEDRPARGEARDAILAAALDVIAQDGLDAVTHRRVADLAGVSPGSTTYHFASREELIRAAFALYMGMADRILSTLDRTLRISITDPAERVRELLCGVVAEEFGDDRRVRAEYEMILFASKDQELSSFLRQWETRWVGYLATDLEAAGAARAVETARILINITRGYEMERLTHHELGVEDLRRRLQTVLNSLLDR